jgi:hypothetical protein
VKIVINEVPLSKNKYVNLHWAKRRAYKDNIAWLIIGETVNRKYPTRDKATVIFDIYFKAKRRRDVANYLGGGLISWLDILVDKGFIADDSWDCIGQPIVNFNIDKENPRTEIIIKGLEVIK